MCGDVVADVRVPHKGDVSGQVIEGAYTVPDGFDLVRERRDAMRAITLQPREAEIFAHAALALKYDGPVKPAPISFIKMSSIFPIMRRHNRVQLRGWAIGC